MTLSIALLSAQARGARPVPRFSLHDLRSTSATWLRNAGVDPLIIKHLMGHSLKTGDVTDSYTKIFEQSMREAVALFDEKLRPMTGTTAKGRRYDAESSAADLSPLLLNSIAPV